MASTRIVRIHVGIYSVVYYTQSLCFCFYGVPERLKRGLTIKICHVKTKTKHVTVYTFLLGN